MGSIFVLALSLSVDAFAAAVSQGTREGRWGRGVQVGLWFGGFQAGMTWIGGLFGQLLSQTLWTAGQLLSFGLLAFLGLRMAWEGISPSREGKQSEAPLPLLALATSLDALAAGVSLRYLGGGLWRSGLVIGLVTYALSCLGALLGRELGGVSRRRANLLGGLVLLLLGGKILLSG